MYTGSLKIGTPKNREFWENLAFFKTCDLLKIGNFKNCVTLAIPEFKRTSVYENKSSGVQSLDPRKWQSKKWKVKSGCQRFKNFQYICNKPEKGHMICKVGKI